MNFKFSDDVPIYLQIIEGIKVDIVSGRVGIYVGYELERQGLVASERTSGRYVSIDEEKIKALQKDLSEQYISDLFEHLRNLGMDDKTIVDAVNKWEDK